MKFKIKNIPADASHRNFYRLIFKKKSRILISAKKDKYKNLIAYTAINKFLRSKKILAPKLFEYNFLKGEIVIEDFGNITFHKILVNQKNKFKTYKKIIDLLIKIQKIKPKYKIKNVNNKFHTIDKYSYKHLNNESNSNL